MREMIISAIYIEMLGHDASFSYIQAVNITQSKSFPLKKIGYLACCLFLNENSEFLLLLVSAIQKDLQSKKEEDISLALTALGKLLCNMIVFAVSEPVLKLLTHESVRLHEKKKQTSIIWTSYLFIFHIWSNHKIKQQLLNILKYPSINPLGIDQKESCNYYAKDV